MPNPILIKLGGSLLHHNNGEILRKLGSIINERSALAPVIIVPGGGPFADGVRAWGKRLTLKEETCHYMALAAMDQYAFLLQEFIPGSSVTDLLISDLKSHSRPCSGTQILLCSGFIRQVPLQDLARSWDVTSDSIAAYLARYLCCTMLITIKSADIGPLLQEPDVDRYFEELLPLDFPAWFLNGFYPERLDLLLKTGGTRGLYLPPQSRCARFVL